jgi:hypothetical protein
MKPYAQKLIETLDANGVPPTVDYVAYAGQDYGYAAAWPTCTKEWVVRLTSGGESSYCLVDEEPDAAELAEMLAYDYRPTGWDYYMYRAEILGPSGLKAHSGADTYRILVVRHYYGRPDKLAWLCDEAGDPWEDTRDCREAVLTCRSKSEAPYELGHGESSRPSYYVVGW